MAPVAADEWVDAPQHQDGWVDIAPHAGGASGSWDEPPNAMQRLGTKVQAGIEKVGGWGGPLSFLNPVGQVSGVAKGVMSTSAGLYKLAGDITHDPVAPETTAAIDTALTPRNPAEYIGKFGEQAAEFAVGEGALTKAATKVPALAKLAASAPRIARAASAAISGAGVAKAQGASNKQAAITGAAGAGLPALIEGTAAGVKWLGTRTMASGLGISGKQAAAGASPETLTKYGLARATLKGTLEAVHGKITGLATDMRNILKGANAGVVEQAPVAGIAAEPLDQSVRVASRGALPGANIGGGATVAETAAQRSATGSAHRQAVIDAIKSGKEIPPEVAQQYPDLTNSIALSKIPGPKIDLGAAVDSVESMLLSHEAQLHMSPTEVQQVRGALAQYRSQYAQLPRGAIVPLDEAQTVKRAAGLAGAWEHGKSSADKGMERVSNLVFGYLKQAIDQGAGGASPQLRAINGQLSELMPLEQAIVRRIPVEARQAPIALTDWMLIATGHPIEAGARMTLKTFPVGIGAGGVKLAQGMRTTTRPLTASVQEILASQQDQPQNDDLANILSGGQKTVMLDGKEVPITRVTPVPRHDFSGGATGPAPNELQNYRAGWGPIK